MQTDYDKNMSVLWQIHFNQHKQQKIRRQYICRMPFYRHFNSWTQVKKDIYFYVCHNLTEWQKLFKYRPLVDKRPVLVGQDFQTRMYNGRRDFWIAESIQNFNDRAVVMLLTEFDQDVGGLNLEVFLYDVQRNRIKLGPAQNNTAFEN